MSACLDGYAQWLLLGGEASPEGFGGGAQSRPSSITSPLCVSMTHRWEYLSPRSNPAVIFSCALLPSMVGRSSFPYWALEPVEYLQTLRVLRIWGVGLLISSSESGSLGRGLRSLRRRSSIWLSMRQKTLTM